jgi:hypothetical protein
MAEPQSETPSLQPRFVGIQPGDPAVEPRAVSFAQWPLAREWMSGPIPDFGSADDLARRIKSVGNLFAKKANMR